MYDHSILHRFARTCCIIFLIACVFGVSSAFADAPDPDMAGTWKGTLANPEGDDIDLFLEFFKTAEGEDRAFLTVPSQDFGPTVAENMTLDGEKFRFEVSDANGVYEGTLERGKQITGTWKQGEAEIELNFVRETD